MKMRVVLSLLLSATVFSQTGEITKRLSSTVLYSNVALSPDGRLAAWIQATEEGGTGRLQVASVPGGRARPITIQPASGRALYKPSLQIAIPRWSPDGRHIAFIEGLMSDEGFHGGDLRDIHAGIDAAVARHPIDTDRLGVTGWSYGGYMTMWTVTQTNRFRAAVAGAGIANWQSYYGQNLIDRWMVPFFGASVYDDPAVYAKSSPNQFIKNVKTPTLVVVGEHDAECPAPQSFEFWFALRALGVTTQLVVYPGEGHMFVDPKHQGDVKDRTIAWFDKYLKTGP